MTVVPANIEHRVKCVVPFCRHTRKPEGSTEWICATHWRLVPYWRKRVFFQARKRLWTAWDKGLPGVPPNGRFSGLRLPEPIGWRHWLDADFTEWLRARAAFWRVWRRLKRHAIEAAAGIG